MQTLEHLTLDFEYHPSSEDTSTIGSLRSFPNLKTLSIRLDDLIEHDGEDEGVDRDDEAERQIKLVDMLPESVEVVELTGCDETAFPILFILAEERMERLPRLERVNILMKVGQQRSECEEKLLKVRKAFGDDHEVDVVYVNWHGETELP